MTTSDQERAAPAQQPVADWLWFGEDADGEHHVSFGRWQKHACQMRYKLADIQPTEHDHPSSEPELRAEIVSLTRERDEHERMRTLYVTSAQEEHARAEAAESRVEALSADVGKFREMSGPEELRALVEEMRALAKRHVNLVKTGAAYAAGELRGAPTSTFEIYIGHFREIGKEIEAVLTRAESSLASPAGMEGWTRAVRDVFEIELKINRAEPMEAMERALAAASVEFAAPHGEAK